MAKMLAAAHGKNQAERPECCKNEWYRFSVPGGKRLRKRIQRHREERAWKKGE